MEDERREKEKEMVELMKRLEVEKKRMGKEQK